jgi:L-lysine exporter family protein LysE/ArgO
MSFGLGAVTASVSFFFGLGYGARLLRPIFNNPRAWQVLDALIALTMWAIAIKLIWF